MDTRLIDPATYIPAGLTGTPTNRAANIGSSLGRGVTAGVGMALKNKMQNQAMLNRIKAEGKYIYQPKLKLMANEYRNKLNLSEFGIKLREMSLAQQQAKNQFTENQSNIKSTANMFKLHPNSITYGNYRKAAKDYQLPKSYQDFMSNPDATQRLAVANDIVSVYRNKIFSSKTPQERNNIINQYTKYISPVAQQLKSMGINYIEPDLRKEYITSIHNNLINIKTKTQAKYYGSRASQAKALTLLDIERANTLGNKPKSSSKNLKSKNAVLGALNYMIDASNNPTNENKATKAIKYLIALFPKVSDKELLPTLQVQLKAFHLPYTVSGNFGSSGLLGLGSNYKANNVRVTKNNTVPNRGKIKAKKPGQSISNYLGNE